MAYNIAQTKSAQGVGPVTSVAVAFTSNVLTGNEVIACCANFDSAAGSIPSGAVTDSRSTSYTQRNPSTTAQARSAIHHGTLASSGACTVTLNVANSADYPTLAIHEVSGLTTAPYDQGATATGTGTPTATTGTTTTANQLVIAMLTHAGSANQALAVGSGYTLAEKQENTTNQPIITAHKRVTATGAQTATFGAIVSAPAWVLSVATFKESSGTPTVRGTPQVGYHATGGPITLTPDVAPQLGDVILAFLANDSGNVGSYTVPSGFNLIRNTNDAGSVTLQMASYYKIATASEPANYAFSVSGSVALAAGLLVIPGAYTGGTPVDQHNGTIASGTSGTTLAASGVTTTGTNDLLVACFAIDNGGANIASPTITLPGTMTNRGAISGAGIVVLRMGSEDLIVAGATGTRTATTTSVTARAGQIVTILASGGPNAPTALVPAPVGVTTLTARWSVAGSGGTPTGYLLDVATDSAFTAIVAGYSNLDVGNVTAYAVSGLSPSTTYYYRVRAYNPTGTSASSGNQSATTGVRQLPFRVGTDRVGGTTTRVLDGTLVVSGTTYTQSLSGALTPTAGARKLAASRSFGGVTPSGSTIKQEIRRTLGSLTVSGGVIRQLSSRALGGTLTPSGALLRAALNRTPKGTLTPTGNKIATVADRPSGVLTPSGVTSLRTNLVRSGTLTPSGARIASLARVLSGALSSSGTLARTRAVLLALSGALSPAGSLLRRPAVVRAGSTTPQGTVLRALWRSLAGGTPPTGTISPLTRKNASGTVSPAGFAIFRPVRLLSGVLTPTGIVRRSAPRALNGALAPSGSRTALPARLLSGTLAATGTRFARLSRSLSAALGSSGVASLQRLSTVIPLALAGTLSSSGSLARSAGRTLSAALTPTGTRRSSLARTISAALTPTGNRIARPSPARVGVLTPTGTTTRRTNLVRSGALASSGTVGTSRLTNLLTISLSGTVASTGAVARKIVALYTGSTTPGGVLARRAGIVHRATVGPAGTMSRSQPLALGGTLASVGALIRRTSRQVGGALASTGTLRPLANLLRSGALAFAGTIRRSVSVVRAAILSPAGSRIARFPVALSGQFSGTGTLARRMLATYAGTGGATGAIVRSAARVVGGALHLAGVLVRSRDAPIARLDQDHPASFREESVSGAIAGTDSGNRFHDTAIGRFIADRVVGRFRP